MLGTPKNDHVGLQELMRGLQVKRELQVVKYLLCTPSRCWFFMHCCITGYEAADADL